eukprot:1080175-Pelagomonas_calceolata.AAC.3
MDFKDLVSYEQECVTCPSLALAAKMCALAFSALGCVMGMRSLVSPWPWLLQEPSLALGALKAA